MTTKRELTIDTLKEKTGITDNQLDMRIVEGQCRRLASLFGSWKKYTDSPGLSLGPGQYANLCAIQEGNEEAMTKALKFWLDNNPFQTYRHLIEILLELKEGLLVNSIIEFVMKHYPDKEDNITSIVASSSRMYSGNISSRIDHFEGRFRTLRLSTLKYLEETNSSITDIKHSLLALPLAIRNEHEKLLVVKYSLVEKAESVGGVFAIITSYLSYLDYSLLEHIIKEFGSESLKSQMKVYARDMKEFRMNTTISSIIPYLPRRSDLQEGFAALKIKLNFDPDTMTLEDLNEQRKQLASEFLLSDFALLMTQFRGGSLKVEWLIPKAVVSFLRQFVKDKPVSAIEKLQISQLSIDDEVLYPLLSSEELTTELPDTIQQMRQSEMARLPLTAAFKKDKVPGLTTTGQETQQEVEKVSQKILAKNEPWLVPPEDVFYPDQPKFTSTQNNAITTEGTFKGATVAVKRLNLEKSKPEDHDAIHKEIHILTQIRHPNIVQFIAATDKPQIGHMIITELLKISLASTRRKRIEEIQLIFVDIALALIYLHTHKEPIIHRDVRPVNIYLTPRLTDPPSGVWHSVFDDTWDETWMAKLSGFGSAIFARDANTLESQAMIETTEYTAPEAPEQITTKSDIYGFGKIMNFCPDNRFSLSSNYGSSDTSKRYEHDVTWGDFLGSGHDITWDDISYFCTQSSPDQRPTMNQALEQLNKLEEL